MSKLVPGTVAILKTSEEPCFILAINPGQGDPEYADLSGTTVTVRRPVASESTGIQHVISVFYAEELESQEDRNERAYNEMMSIRGKFKGGQIVEVKDPSSLPDLN